MRLVVQRVTQASVKSEREGHAPLISEISKGLCVLVGFERDDTSADCVAMAKQLLKLRLFDSEENADRSAKCTLNMSQAGADLLLVSQFTLAATLRSNRPAYHHSMPAEPGLEMFDAFVELCKEGLKDSAGVVRTGIFGAMMKVSLVNDGPFTICLTCKDGKCTTW